MLFTFKLKLVICTKIILKPLNLLQNTSLYTKLLYEKDTICFSITHNYLICTAN